MTNPQDDANIKKLLADVGALGAADEEARGANTLFVALAAYRNGDVYRKAQVQEWEAAAEKILALIGRVKHVQKEGWRPPPQPRAIDAAELKKLGATSPAAFFDVLRPGAIAAERKYGVPAAVTLAQAALESGFGKYALPGFNIFGIKGRGSAGSTNSPTEEVINGRRISIRANFAAYNSLEEALDAHGRLFRNGYYNKAIHQFARDRDPFAFARNITGIYATDPEYGQKLTEIMRRYDLA